MNTDTQVTDTMFQTESLPVLLRSRAETDGDRLAYLEVDGTSATYAELHAANLAWAQGFAALGVEAHQPVVTMIPNGLDAVSAWLGLAWLRAVEVPCNLLYKGRTLAHLVTASGAQVLVVAHQFLDRLAEVADSLPSVRAVVVPDGSVGDLPLLPFRVVNRDEFFAATGGTPEGVPEMWDLAALFFTSGTTGPSKGVRCPWGQLYTQARGSFPDGTLGPDDRYYMPFAMNHVTGKTPFYQMVLHGGSVVVRPSFSGTQFWDDIRTYGVTTTALVGTMAAWLQSQPPDPADRDHPLRNVVMVPVVPAVEAFCGRFGVRVCTIYGMTEISVPLTSGWTVTDANRASCGRVRPGFPGYEVRLVDEHDRPVPDGEVGELIVRTAVPWTLNAGYEGQSAQTAGAWRNGWFHTGDAFRRDGDGQHYFVDRIKDCIRRRGENISSFEVEAEVNAHPEVVESAAVAVPAAFGEDDVMVVAVRAAGSTLDEGGLIDFLQPKVPKFMLPRYVLFAGELPKTDGGQRVRKVELRGRQAEAWDRERPVPGA